MVMSYLKGDVGKLGSGLGHSRLMLAAVDCVWCAVVGNPMVEDMFLESEGALILLDLLRVRMHAYSGLACCEYVHVTMQACPSNMQSLILGVLVDLCENPKVSTYIQWNLR